MAAVLVGRKGASGRGSSPARKPLAVARYIPLSLRFAPLPGVHPLPMREMGWSMVGCEVERMGEGDSGSLNLALNINSIAWSLLPMSEEINTPSASTRQRRKGGRGRRKPKIGEKGIRYGSRNFLITPGQGLVAQDGPWHLVAVPSWEREGWWNFKLYLDEPAPKNLFNISIC